MTESGKSSISIITATYNAAAILPNLIESLIAQTDQDFEWVVADGGSTDGTLEILEKAKSQLKKVVVDSRLDLGIYDALNRAIKLSSSEYYAVFGSDDELFPRGIEHFKKNLKANSDFITFKYYSGNKIIGIRSPRWEFLFSQFAYITGHAVGLLIRKSLHDEVGYYSREFTIAADQFFIISAIRNGANVDEKNFVIGKFCDSGISNIDAARSLTEFFRVNLRLGHNFYVQLILLVLRLLKNKSKISKQKA